MMASIYKRRELRPIPDGAQRSTYRGEPCVVWTDDQGKARRALLNPEGTAIIQEAKYYSCMYFDERGKRRQVTTGCGDKGMALQVASKLELEANLRKRGHIDPAQERLAAEYKRAIDDHLADFKASMESAARTSDHVHKTIGFIQAIVNVAGWHTLADIEAAGVNTYSADLLARGLSARTVQARLTAIKSFTRWLLKHDKLARDPLISVKTPNPAKDRRHERRMLLPEEWTWLRWTTMDGPDRYGMAGRARTVLYATAIQTGLRSSECASLTRGRLFLAETPPYIVCKARSTKNAKDCKQYIQRELADELARHVSTKAPTARVFNMPTKGNVARMFRADLSDSRRAWLSAARGPEERLQREHSDFLAYENHEGERLDFHALRHTTGAWLSMAGVHPKVVQSVMRHSMITLTMDIYGHLFPGQTAAAVELFPSMMTDRRDDDGERQLATCLRATCLRAGTHRQTHRQAGTADAAAVTGQRNGSRNGSSGTAKPCMEAAGPCEVDKRIRDQEDMPNVLRLNTLCR